MPFHPNIIPGYIIAVAGIGLQGMEWGAAGGGVRGYNTEAAVELLKRTKVRATL